MDSEKILAQLKKKTPSPISTDSESHRKTPGSVRGVRRAVKALRTEMNTVNTKMKIIIRAAEKLVVHSEILEHENVGLRTALINEKKKQKRKANGFIS